MPFDVSTFWTLLSELWSGDSLRLPCLYYFFIPIYKITTKYSAFNETVLQAEGAMIFYSLSYIKIIYFLFQFSDQHQTIPPTLHNQNFCHAKLEVPSRVDYIKHDDNTINFFYFQYSLVMCKTRNYLQRTQFLSRPYNQKFPKCSLNFKNRVPFRSYQGLSIILSATAYLRNRNGESWLRGYYSNKLPFPSKYWFYTWGDGFGWFFIF